MMHYITGMRLFLLLLCLHQDMVIASIDSLKQLESLVKSGNLSLPPWFYTGKKINVTLDLELSDVREMNPENMEVELGYFRHLSWVDPRLQYKETLTSLTPYISWESDMRNTVWTPNIHVTNAVISRLHTAPDVNIAYHLYPNGTILESASISTTLICNKAPVYPKIELNCVMRFESYGHTNKELGLHWKVDGPQSRTDFFSSPTFDIQNVNLKEDCKDVRNVVGIFSCIEISMVVYQMYQPFVTEIFLPSTLIVLTAWMTFWIDKGSVPARASLGGLCLIASITHSTGLVLGLRHNIEWHSVNIWLNTCITFVCLALLEYGLVHFLVRRAKRLAQIRSNRYNSASSYQEDSDESYGEGTKETFNELHALNTAQTERITKSEESSLLPRHKKVIRKLKSNPGKIDTVMRVVYPVLFLAFVVFYWIYFTRTD